MRSSHRYGVISDVHGNLHALVATLRALQALGVDRYLCAGDIVGYGPMPNECLETIVKLPGVVVAGNHDLMAIGNLPIESMPPSVRVTQEWTRQALSAESRRIIEALPVVAEEGTIVMTHAALESRTDYIHTPDEAAKQLATLRTQFASKQLLVLGHTHRQWLYGERSGDRGARGRHTLDNEADLLNPGSVGQSRQMELLPRARFAVLDMSRRRLEFHAVGYDRRGARRALRERGLPENALHTRPSPLTAVRRMARRSAR